MIYKGWLNFEISSGVDYLQKLTDETEEMLNQRSNNFSTRLDEIASSLNNEQKEEFYDFNLEGYWDLKKEFPNTLRKSIISTSYSFFENQLKSICKYIDFEYTNKIPSKSSKPDIVLYRDFICKQKGMDLEEKSYLWEIIDQYRIVRNNLIHEYGFSSKKIIRIIEKNPEIIVENDLIYLSHVYVLNFINCIREYLLYISNKI